MDLPEKMDTLEDKSVVDQVLPPIVSPNPEQPIVQERKDFTSEIYKIEIKNLGKFGFGVRNVDWRIGSLVGSLFCCFKQSNEM